MPHDKNLNPLAETRETQILQKLLSHLNDSDNPIPIDEILALVNKIPQLANSIINHINSPDFGVRHEVSNVAHAIAMLGPNRVVDFLGKRLRQDMPHFEHEMKKPTTIARRTIER